jgi:LacI family gluconate utilization system Gnt-I transcriptional repressor
MGREALHALLARHPDLDAIFFSTDVFAVGALFECQRLGWPVPERIAIAGFGDLELASEAGGGLTTVRIPAYAIGEQAAALLLERLREGSVDRRVVDLGFEIIGRASA